MKDSLTVGSMFAGVGGICLGFKQAGSKVIWANENDINACKTYKFNFKETNLFEVDVHQLNPGTVDKVDIITSGFPCQAFSIAGYREGFQDKQGRGNLFFQTAKFIDELKPKAFLLENVKNLSAHDGGNTLNVIRDTITKGLNYSFISFILNAKDYGNIPQTRERIYIIGFKDEGKYSVDDKIKNPSVLTHHFKIPEKLPLKKSIKDLFDNKEQDERFYYRATHKYFKTLTEEMKSRATIYQWRRIYVRENKSNLCPTLTANMGTGGHNVPLIIDDFGIRKLTPAECMRFQGFPKDFNFPADMALSHRYKQAGNSVVVPVIRRIAEEMIRVLGIKN